MDSCSVDKISVLPARDGDFDPIPPAPASEMYELIADEREIKIRPQEEAPAHNEEQLPDPPAASGSSFGSFIFASTIALLILFCCNFFYSVLHNIVVARTGKELCLAWAMFAVTVAVFAYIALRARRLFSHLPKIDSVKESEYAHDPLNLMKRVKSDYISPILKRKDAYAADLKLTADHELIGKLFDLSSDRYVDSLAFLEDFKLFQRQQGEKAAKIIFEHAKQVAIKTAASPWKIVDMLSVFYNSSSMIYEIALVYNRQIRRSQAFRLSLRWMFNIYIAGELGAIADKSGEAIDQSIRTMIGDQDVSSLVAPALPLLSKFIGKFAEGGVNAYNVYRLGKCAVAEFKYLV